MNPDRPQPPVGMARRALPVAERSVRRRNEGLRHPQASASLFRAGTAQRTVPTACVRCSSPFLYQCRSVQISG